MTTIRKIIGCLYLLSICTWLAPFEWLWEITHRRQIAEAIDRGSAGASPYHRHE